MLQGGGNSNGVRRAVAELTEAQSTLGHRVLIHLSGHDPFDDDAASPARRALREVGSSLKGLAVFGFSPSGERWTDSSVAASFGILHQHGIWQAHSRITRRWRATYGRPTVVCPHGSLQHTALTYSRWKKVLALAAYERSNLRDASCLHATAEQEIGGFRDLGLRNPVAVISNTASEDWISSDGDGVRFRAMHGLPPTGRMMLYLSRIHPIKNLLGLLEAMAQIPRGLNGWRLTIAGPVDHGPYHVKVRQAVHDFGLTDRVHWVGELRGQAKRDAFAAAELFVLPTLSDSFAIVVAESLAAGVPVVTTQEALPWSLLEEHGCGWWVPASQVHLIGALRAATHKSSAQLAAMGDRGRALIEQEFRWIDIARRTEEMYGWLLGRSERPDFVVLD